MTACIVNDKSMWDGSLPEFPTGQRSALITGPGLINPDMYRHASLHRFVDHRQCGAPVDGGQRTGITVREYVQVILILRFSLPELLHKV